jgi:hypothetical protein
MKTNEKKSYAGGGAAWPVIAVAAGSIGCLLAAALYGVFCHFARLAVMP